MSDTAVEQQEGIGPLDLSSADLSGFTPMPSGTQVRAEVFAIKPTAIKADTKGKLPAGTPGYSVQARVLNEGEGSQYFNRRVFNNFWIPGPEYDKDKGDKMRGMFVNFLISLGYTKEEVMSGSFQVDEDDIEGREFILKVGVKAAVTDGEGGEIYPAQNTFLATKSLAEGGAAESSALM